MEPFLSYLRTIGYDVEEDNLLSLEEEFAALEYTLQYVDKSAELVADLFTDYNYLPTASPNVALVHYNCNANVSLPPLCANSTILLLFFIALCEVSESRTYELMFNLFAVVMISTDILPISPRGKLYNIIYNII